MCSCNSPQCLGVLQKLSSLAATWFLPTSSPRASGTQEHPQGTPGYILQASQSSQLMATSTAASTGYPAVWHAPPPTCPPHSPCAAPGCQDPELPQAGQSLALLPACGNCCPHGAAISFLHVLSQPCIKNQLESPASNQSVSGQGQCTNFLRVKKCPVNKILHGPTPPLQGPQWGASLNTQCCSSHQPAASKQGEVFFQAIPAASVLTV